MNRVNYILCFGMLICLSCNKRYNGETDILKKENELKVTIKGDTLENGFWVYDTDINGISKSGNYKDGYKIGKWTYKTEFDSVSIVWNIFNHEEIDVNIPYHLKSIDNLKPPVIYQADIVDNDDNTYLALLGYNLKDLDLSIYDYLYQYNQSLESDSLEVLKFKEFKKFTFKNIDIFKANIELEKEKKYTVISYIFVVNGRLYDLTYKNIQDKVDTIALEIFNDILYSMKCGDFDLFNFNNKKYLKEEDVIFE